MSKKYKMHKHWSIQCTNKVNGQITRLYRISALTTFHTSFYNVQEGELGGWVESEDILSQNGNSWISPSTYAFNGAIIRDNAQILSSETYIINSILEVDSIIKINAWFILLNNLYLNNQICDTDPIKIDNKYFIISNLLEKYEVRRL